MNDAVLDTKEIFRELTTHAENHRNDEHQFVGAMAIGDCQWQGDVGFVYAGEELPKNIKVKKIVNPQAQLAAGNTQGARHVLQDVKSCEQYEVVNGNPLDGPALLTNGFTVTHPEHGDLTFGPGCYFVTYQKEHAEELRRVQD